MEPTLSVKLTTLCRSTLQAATALALVGSLLLPSLPSANAGARETDRPKRIYSQFVILPRADFNDFEATLQRTLDASRQQLEGEFSGMLEPLAYMTDDLPGLAMVIARVMIQFEDMAKRHRAEVHTGVPEGLADELIAGFDQSYRALGLSEEHRRARFVELSDLGQQALAKTRAGVRLEPAEAKALRNDVDLLLLGGYSIMPGGTISLTVRLLELKTGNMRSFAVRARASSAGAVAGAELFKFFQENQYLQWANPAPELSWIPQPEPAEPVMAGVARMGCRTQGARIPFARELIQASLATQFRSGGIARLRDNVMYVVADRQRSDEQHYYTTGKDGVSRTGGPVHTSAGYGRISAYFWCVKGAPAPDVAFFEHVYRLLRKVRADRNAAPEVPRALEYILWSLEDFGANQFPDLRFRFASLDEAVEALASHGIFVTIPNGL